MNRGFFSLLGLAGVIACHPPPVPPSSVVYTIANHTEKALAVVVAQDNAEEHEPREVPVEVVKRAMQTSSFFTEEDIGELARPVADALPEMGAEEYVRVVAWEANQPRYYYVYVRGGKLRIYFQRGSQIIERHATTIPAETVALAGLPTPAPPLTEPPAAPVAPGAAPAPEPRPAPADSAARPRSRPAVAHRPAPRGAKPSRLTEDQVREKLHGLDRLRDRKLVSTAEYREKRQEILNRL